MDRDKGWEFLFNDNKKSGSFQSEDGSEGYIYSDGSGYYKGADGSEGRIYSDGSGYYKGADGSDGFKYSDGSGYFRGGSDDVNAFQYSDGSGYYGDSKQSRSFYWPIEKPRESSASYSESSHGSSHYGGTSYYYGKSKFSFKRLLRKICKILKIIKKIIIGIIITAVVGFIAYNVYEFCKQIPVGFDSTTVQGQQYEAVIEQLEDAGFKNVTSQPLADLELKKESLVGVVDHISIDGTAFFASDTKFTNDADVIVFYHSIRLISPPILSIVAKGQDFNAVLEMYKQAGFVNVKLEPIDDIVFGWIKKDGSVESITIDGETRFSTEYTYRPDVEVVISYHTFPDE